MECADGVCKKQLPYFSNDNYDMNLMECVIYLSITPLIYFALLIILEEGLFDKLYIKMSGQNLRNACDMKDEQVEKEKRAVALEIRKLNNRGEKSFKIRFISSNMLGKNLIQT